MIFRLEYKNKDGLQARLDITTPGSSIVEEIEGNEQPFLLSYKGDKNDKSFNFLTSSAEINIYETPEFNIDILKTSNETQIKVDYYISGSLYWAGFVIPDFFSREIGGAGVVSMVASDRLSTLKGVTLSDLPSMISIRDLAVQCLEKTGLSLPLRTIADFQHGSTVNGFLTSEVSSQRLYDTRGRSISCYDVLKSILVASNSRLEQSGGEWRITNKLQHELGTGRVYSNENTFASYAESVFNFSEITRGAMRTIVPVAGSVGIYHEHGGGKIHPDNFDFSRGMDEWQAVGGFDCSIEDREVLGFTSGYPMRGVEYGEQERNRLMIRQSFDSVWAELDSLPHVKASFPVITTNKNSVNIEIDISVLGSGWNVAWSTGRFLVLAENGSDRKAFNPTTGAFEVFDQTKLRGSDSAYFIKLKPNWEKEGEVATRSAKFTAPLEVDGDLSDYTVTVRAYGVSDIVGAYTPLFVNKVGIRFNNTQDAPKGVIYKTDQGGDFTKTHDIETTIFGDYLTRGLDGYFYDYPIDDTSSLYRGGELTSLWTTPFVPGEDGAYNLLRHSAIQHRRMFSVAHDLISGEIEMDKFDPLSIFVDCNGKRYVVVSAEFDFLRSNVKVELEEIAYENLTVRDYIYSYFGEGESGISSVGGISTGTGGGSGSGMTSDQVATLSNLASWWKLDDDGNLFSERNVYSTKELSAYGFGSGSGGGGSSGGIIETVYGYSNLGQTFNNTVLTDTFNAYTINQINNRLLNVEAGGGANDGTLTLSTGTGLTGSASFSANQSTNSTFIVSPIFGTTAGTIAQGNDSRIVNGQTAFDWGDYRQYGLGTGFSNNPAFEGDLFTITDTSFKRYTSSASNAPDSGNGNILNISRTVRYKTRLAFSDSERFFFTTGVDGVWKELYHSGNFTPSNYVPTSRTITAGTGLTGGGDLTANRTLALDTVYTDLRYYGYTDSAIDAIEIGGRNLVLNGSIIHSWNGSRVVGTSAGAFLYTTDFQKGVLYQIEARTSDVNLIGAVFGWQYTEDIQGKSIILSNEWQKAYCIVPANFSGAIGLRVKNGTGNIELRNVKAEKGNKATDWTPAPEDVQAEIDSKLSLTGGTLTGSLTAPNFIGALSGNASTATTLQTPRTIWGQSFNGSGNVSGALSGATTGNFSGTVTAPTFSGALSGNASTATTLASSRSISMTGDVAWSVNFNGGANVTATGTIQSNAVTTAKILDNNVTFAKIQNIATNRILGRSTAGTGNIEALTTIPSTVLGNSSLYIGTTAVALNRASGTLSLTGIGSLAMNAALTGATQLNASQSVNTPKVSIGSNWSLLTKTSNTSFVIKYGDADKMEIKTSNSGVVNFYSNLFIQDSLTAGSIFSESDILAYEVKAYENVNTPKVIFNAAGWSMEQVGTELQMKHNGNIRMRFLSDGSIVATDEIAAFA